MNLLILFWRDERGFTASTELVLIGTILIIGMIVGLATYRDQVVQELGDAAMAVSQQNQSYFIDFNGNGIVDDDTTIFDFNNDGNADLVITVTDSQYIDNGDFCDHPDPDPICDPPACINIGAAADNNLEEGGTQNQPQP